MFVKIAHQILFLFQVCANNVQQHESVQNIGLVSTDSKLITAIYVEIEVELLKYPIAFWCLKAATFLNIYSGIILQILKLK
jgi:hypothetical protein